MRFSTAGGLTEAATHDINNGYSIFKEHPSSELKFAISYERKRRGAHPTLLLASLTISRSRIHQGPRGLLASLTGFGFFLGRDAGLRKTFNSIDVDGKGHITHKDLEAFAIRNGLPSSYAAHFANAVRATASDSGAVNNRGNSGSGCISSSSGCGSCGVAGEVLASQQQSLQSQDQGQGQGQQQRGQGQQQRTGVPDDAELTFAMFRRFVRSREEALRRAFNLFDQDGDGRISVDDLDASLSQVAVCCPQTRCIYRCPKRMAQQLHSKVVEPEHGSLGFSEFRDFFLLLPQQDMLVEYWVAAGAAPELSDKVSISRTGDPGAKGSPWGHLLAGAVAGATSRTATAPLETLRLAAMAGQLQSRSLAQAANDIVSSQGWRGLYRGNLLNVMRSAPQKALDFFAFDAFKRLIGDDTHVQTFLAAGLAGCTSWVALYPLEVVRSRITVSAAAAAAAPTRAMSVAAAAATAAGGLGGSNSGGLLEALSSIVRHEGPGALYKGLGPSVAAIFPEAAITYGLHDALKKAYTRMLREEPGVAPSLAFGVLSAFMGQLVSFPLETVSRRLQVAQGGGVGAGGGLAAAAAVVRGLLAEGGPAALYRGIGAATLRLVPMACVSFGTYEAVRALIMAWEQQREEEQVKAMLTSRCVPLVLEGPNGGQEVVGRLCTSPGDGTPSLCGAVNPSCCGPSTGALEVQRERADIPPKAALPPSSEAAAAATDATSCAAAAAVGAASTDLSAVGGALGASTFDGIVFGAKAAVAGSNSSLPCGGACGGAAAAAVPVVADGSHGCRG